MHKWPMMARGAVALALALLFSGCGGSVEQGSASKLPSGSSGAPPSSHSAESETGAEAPLLEPFDAPSLAELDAKAEWSPQPVVDSYARFVEHWSKQPKLAMVAQALSLQNTSKEANAKIANALGRPPENDRQVAWDAGFNHHLPMDIKSTNPIMVSSVAEVDLSNLTAFGLFGFDWNLEPFALADTVASWHSSKDRTMDKVVLRGDLVWSDGTPITAHDVVFSFQTIMNPKVPVPAVRSGTDELRWVHAYDERTLVYFHKKPLATNVWNLNFPVIPRHVYEKSLAADPTLQNSEYHVQQEDNPVTGGPYAIVRRRRGQEIVLARRESWYLFQGKPVRARPFFKEIRLLPIEDRNTSLLALKSGSLDEMELNAEQWTTQTTGADFYARNTKATGTEWVFFFFCWNCRDPMFRDVRVRQAMSYAFDHKEMLERHYYGLYEPCVGIFHPKSWMAPTQPPKPYTQDLDKAEELLDQAGWLDSDGDGIRDKEIDGLRRKFEFNLLCANVEDRVRLCTLLKENLGRIGVLCNVQPLEFTVLQAQMLEHKFQACFGGWGTGADPDTSSNIWTTAAIAKGRNYGYYSNPEVDRLFELGKTEFDRAKRAEIYGRIHELIYQDQPYTFLYFRNSFYGFNKQLRGYLFSPRGPYNYGPGVTALWKALP